MADGEEGGGGKPDGVQAGFVPALPWTGSLATALPLPAAVVAVLPPASVAAVLPPPALEPPFVGSLASKLPVLESIAPLRTMCRSKWTEAARSPLSLLLWTVSALMW
jgi:hypothetical protein